MRAIKCYCDGCGLDYEDPGWIEAIVPDEVWWKIAPDPNDKRGGLLCIICIARRCKEAGLKDVPVRLCGTEVLRAVTTDRALFANDKLSTRLIRRRNMLRMRWWHFKMEHMAFIGRIHDSYGDE